jgi:hypothetical protein
VLVSLNHGRWNADALGTMRLLQLSLNPDERAPLELHPMLTVVHGLTERDRQRLIRATVAVAQGTEPECGGLLEAHGVVLDLDSAALRLLDMGADVDPLVRRTDLPGALRTAGEATAEDDRVGDPAASIVATMPRGINAELDRARKRQRDAEQSLAVLRASADQAARDLDAAGRHVRQAAEELDAALSRAASPLGPEHRTGPAGQEVAGLEADLERISEGIGELQGLDTRPLAALLDAIENPGPAEMVPSPRAQELADRIGALQVQIAGVEERMEGEGRGPRSARARLDAASAAVTAAERALQRPEITADDERALREAHEVVLEAERKASGLRARSGQRKLAEALSRQQDILDRVGYPTWSAYIMGASLMGNDPDAERNLVEARIEHEAAEQGWAAVREMLESDEEHHALVDELQRVEVEAVGVLLERGLPVPAERHELELGLRDLREPKHDVAPEQLVEALAFHLESIGYPLGEAATDAQHVRRVAGAFLAEAEGITARIDELANERRHVEARLADARSRAEAEAWAALEASVGLPTDSGATLADLERRLAETRRVEEDLVEVLEAREALLEAAAAAAATATARALTVAASVLAEQEASAQHAEDDVPADGSPAWSEIDPEAIELYLLARLAAQRQVSYAGSVPLVIDDALAGVPEEGVHQVLRGLARMAEAVQVVYVTDDPVVVEWAQDREDAVPVWGGSQDVDAAMRA